MSKDATDPATAATDEQRADVIQADRDAAAAYMNRVQSKRWGIEGILSGGCDNTSIVQAFARHRLAFAARPADLVQADEAREEPLDDRVLAERIAEWLHDEAGLSDAQTSRSWPRYVGDTGRVEGGWIKLVRPDVQAQFREIADRLVRGFHLATTPIPDEAREGNLWKEVISADRETAAQIGQTLGVPDITGPRQQELLARELARYRLALAADETRTALRQATELAAALFNQHYRTDEHYASGRVVWQPLPDLCGVIGQIDNMAAGLIRSDTTPIPDEAKAEPAQGECLRKALVDYMEAVRRLGEIDPVEKVTYFEASPTRNDEALARWQALDTAGKRAAAVLEARP